MVQEKKQEEKQRPAVGMALVKTMSGGVVAVDDSTDLSVRKMIAHRDKSAVRNMLQQVESGQIISIDRSGNEQWMTGVNAYHNRNQLLIALRAFRSTPLSSKLTFNLAMVYKKMDLYEEAVSAFRSV